LATSSPAIRAASVSAMSIPADTPAAVTTLPCCTTRCPVGSAPYRRSVSSSSQCEVARSPSRIPAAPSSSDPVQTDVVHCDVAWTARSQSSHTASVVSARTPTPPGTTITSGAGASASEASASTVSMPLSVRTGPASRPTKRTRPPIRDSTSYGPTASSAVKSS
jgi:hypothetical protein